MEDQHYDPYAPISMGTTLLAIRYKGGVLMASDTRTTSGNFISERFALKGNQISPSVDRFGHIYVLRCGNAAHSQMITRMVHNYLCYQAMELAQDQKLSLKTVVTLFKNICYSNKDFLSCAFLITNGQEIASVNSSGAFFNHDIWASHGSGSAFLDGYMRSECIERLNKASAEKIAVKAVNLAIAADTSSGGCVRLIDVREDGSASHIFLDSHELEKLCPGIN